MIGSAVIEVYASSVCQAMIAHARMKYQLVIIALWGTALMLVAWVAIPRFLARGLALSYLVSWIVAATGYTLIAQKLLALRGRGLFYTSSAARGGGFADYLSSGATKMSSPLFSIVIPVYNRPREIIRAIESCLTQTFKDFELIVVDDASSDTTPEVVKNYEGGRVRTIRLEQNGGLSAARMAGVDDARGEWVLFLDSDDELMPDALTTIERRCGEAGHDIARLAFMYLHDDGRLSPDPWRAGVVMDYAGYLRWAESVRDSDFGNCIRRCSFEVVAMSTDRVYDTGYHLEFARKFKTLCCADVVARLHSDAGDRLGSTGKSSLRTKLVREAEPRMRAMLDILKRHGDALRRHSPRRARVFSRAYITAAFLAGHKRTALRGVATHLRRYPLACSVWCAALLGMLHPGALSWVIAYRKGR